jgi:hypothetical protein
LSLVVALCCRKLLFTLPLTACARLVASLPNGQILSNEDVKSMNSGLAEALLALSSNADKQDFEVFSKRPLIFRSMSLYSVGRLEAITPYVISLNVRIMINYLMVRFFRMKMLNQ